MVETVTNSVIAFIDSSNNPVYLEGVRSYSVDRVPRYIRQPWRVETQRKTVKQETGQSQAVVDQERLHNPTLLLKRLQVLKQ